MTVACYVRKSNDKENDSIENQIAIINDYIGRQKDLKYAEIIQFCDINSSGINMNRDAFQELLKRVRMREIDVVIVKDLSRLGRNYLDICKLTDSIFPFMKVRLIAVSENYDSKHRVPNSMDLPTALRSVLNEYYVLEASKKVRNSCVSRIKNGEFIGSLPYGYVLKDKFTPVVDKEKAEIVREIFNLYLENKTYVAVARILNNRKILTNGNAKWTSEYVRRILKNEQYVGKRIALKYRKDLKTGKKILNDKSEWYIDKNIFPQIVSEELFNKVQKILPESKMPTASGSHIMANKLYCAECGRTLKRNKNFYCKINYKTGESPCFKGSLKANILYKAVLEKVKEFISADIPGFKSDFSFSDIVKIESEITCLKEEKAKIFEQFFSNSITQSEFEKQNSDISLMINNKQSDLKLCRRTVAMNTKYGSECPVDILKRLYASDELTREHMQFVKRINVFNPENFEIIMQSESPLDILCKNIDIYEEG